MKKGIIGLLSVLLITVMAGCGGSSDEATSGSEALSDRYDRDGNGDEGSGTVAVEAPAEEAAVAVEEAVEEAVEAVAEEMTAETTAGDLTGTKWVYDEIELEFREGNKVFLKGGPLAALAPDGTEADYTLEDGVFEVVVLGQTYSGSFDGTALTVDGKAAELLQ